MVGRTLCEKRLWGGAGCRLFLKFLPIIIVWNSHRSSFQNPGWLGDRSRLGPQTEPGAAGSEPVSAGRDLSRVPAILACAVCG